LLKQRVLVKPLENHTVVGVGRDLWRFAPSSTSLMKMIKAIGPNIHPGDALLVHALHPVFVPLITILSAQKFMQFSVHLPVYFSNLPFFGLSMKKSWETVLKLLLNPR